ncbi:MULTISPECIES: phosphoribosyltransferase [unclassified Synechococcus]|uniref:phosphoribosyltransferase n=1 Tax=unclassified Synechococcus TaxID=2626047 RepID=UPI0006527A3A|nr:MULTISPECIES: phosphoribosyltransferase [unclassified Synechococcus]AKN62101.1 phosphoribosyltransferase [Synechococcus sp. WH 8020]|tara:strand:- start:211 stop:606 length:396 start_codon:yes stop_codon:yes gene_type:complete
MQQLTWSQFDWAVEEITARYASHSFIGVYGVPRGGVCLAVALSHTLSLPWLTEPKDGCLVVDDVYETGQTLRAIRQQVDATFVVWMSKCSPEWWNTATTISPDQWLVFPWENLDLAAEDEGRYRASRSIAH